MMKSGWFQLQFFKFACHSVNWCPAARGDFPLALVFNFKSHLPSCTKCAGCAPAVEQLLAGHVTLHLRGLLLLLACIMILRVCTSPA